MKKTLCAVAVAACLGAGACASKPAGRPLAVSNAIPAAAGIVQVSTNKNNNTVVDLKVSHMAPAYRVAPGAQTYVVWARPTGPGAEPYNLGGLSIGDDRSAKLDTQIPYQQFDLFVTAEPSATVTRPSGNPLLWTSVIKNAE